ncbi:UDP-N-acetylmuramoyl-L-alanine--D-glutamate ligase [Candidatus Saccharibacteria bacterium]|nr:UDP-N-acetylmuramoyl-L-alanine--D-glutamate ligase [Candidatus Saccharibacteria bacterium]
MKIAIAGYGLEGRANLEYFRAKFPRAEFTIFDEDESIDTCHYECNEESIENRADSSAKSQNDNNVKFVLGEGALEKIRGFDLVLRSPSIAPYRIPSNNQKVWSATNEFFAECPAPIIGVTGTKGKGTTSSFIAEILRATGRTVHLIGNIGVPALEVLTRIRPNDVVVYELSSFQLWDMDNSPHIAVMTLIEPDHLDIHTDFAEYLAAKSRIFQFQKTHDAAIYHENDALVKEMVETATEQTGAGKIPFLNKKFVHIKQGKFYYNDSEICATTAVKLPGEHNLRNAAAAISAVVAVVSTNSASPNITPDLKQAIKTGLANFHGLPHRLKFVREVGGIKFYDDSIATTPGSAIAAVKSFDEPKILIVGGHDKGADYGGLGETIDRANIRQILAIGANRQKVAQQISAKTTKPIRLLDSQNLAEIVQIAYQTAEPGDIVILSPAAASFDMFHDYQDRGQQFIAAVKDLRK